MELSVGMYVRTEEGEISKIEWITFQSWEGLDNTVEASFWLENKERLEYPRDKFKASHNIKELLQVGDIITYEFPTGLGMLKYENVTILESLLEVLKSSDEYTILSIVTKEAFESMSYKVGE